MCIGERLLLSTQSQTEMQDHNIATILNLTTTAQHCKRILCDLLEVQTDEHVWMYKQL